MSYTKAVRRAAPVMVELSSVSGGGKTTSALLLAAGMAGDGKVALLDTENGRGSLVADDQIILDSLPNGYLYDELTAPFSPERYIEKIRDAAQAGVAVLVIDSASHEFEGIGGISDIAQSSKMKWAPAKMRHRKFMDNCLSSPMDIIFCFRARPKVKIADDKVIDLGILANCEKGTPFEMTFRWSLENGTNLATMLKAPNELKHQGISGRMLTKADGESIRAWKLRGVPVSPSEQIKKLARSTAEEGIEAYAAFCKGLSAEEKEWIKPVHAENKAIAEKADRERADLPKEDLSNDLPDASMYEDGKELKSNGKVFVAREVEGEMKWLEKN